MSTATVVGSGPNGLAGALELARAGLDVEVLEAQVQLGGGTRTSELTGDGLLHDHCAAFHPLGVGSEAFAGLDAHGLRWAWPEIDCAHPLDDGSAGLLYRDIETTVDALGRDGDRWRRVLGPLAHHFDEISAGVFSPLLSVPRHPMRLASFGARATLPTTVLARIFDDPQAKALLAGVAAHAFGRLDRPGSSAPLLLAAAGHRNGWPVAVGGTRAISDALISALQGHGARITTGARVESLNEIDSEVVLLDTSAAAAERILGDRMPERIRRSYRSFRQGPGAYKVDVALDGEIPWRNTDCGRAGTVHLGGTIGELAAAEAQAVAGRMPERPFVLVGQQWLADDSRIAGNLRPVWLYAHVPHGYSGDATDAVLAQVERFAPGFRNRIVDMVVSTPADLERVNENYVGGDIAGGAADLWQLVARPRLSPDPYSTGVDGVYLCSSSTPPGGGVHGMCGLNAARSALRRLSR